VSHGTQGVAGQQHPPRARSALEMEGHGDTIIVASGSSTDGSANLGLHTRNASSKVLENQDIHEALAMSQASHRKKPQEAPAGARVDPKRKAKVSAI